MKAQPGYTYRVGGLTIDQLTLFPGPPEEAPETGPEEDIPVEEAPDQE